jgi:hypothetical protein
MWKSAPELASSDNPHQHVFCFAFFFCNSTIKSAMFRVMICRICQCSCGSVVRVLHLISERLPVLIQVVCFCPIGLCAPWPTLFKSLETKPALTSRRGDRDGGLPPRDNSAYFQYAAWTGTTVYKGETLVLPTGRAFRVFCQSPVRSFNLAIGWALT